MRYINKQLHEGSCGLVAIANAIKWLGVSVSYKRILKAYDYDDRNGMWRRKMSQNLKSVGITYKRKINPTIKDIESSLDNGNSVILAYVWYRYGQMASHFSFIDHHTEGRLMLKNVWADGSAKGVYKRRMGKWFRSSKRWYRKSVEMWEIQK